MHQHAEATAVCTRDQAQALMRFDHHRVSVNGRAGVMLTYDWPHPKESEGPFVLRVVFAYADKHPAAPTPVQAIIEGLVFTATR